VHGTTGEEDEEGDEEEDEEVDENVEEEEAEEERDANAALIDCSAASLAADRARSIRSLGSGNESADSARLELGGAMLRWLLF